MTQGSSALLKRFLSEKQFFLIAFVYIALNVPFLDSYPPIDYQGDESWYMHYSVEFLKTGRMKGSMFPFAGGLDEGSILNPWLYSGTLSAFFFLLGIGLWQGRLLSLLCGLGTLWLTYRTGRDFSDRRVGNIAAALLGTTIFFTWSVREIRPEAMFTMLFTASCYFFYRFLGSMKPLDIFLSSLLMGLLIGVHPNAIVACMSLVVLYFVFYRKVTHRNMLFFLLGFAVASALWFFASYLPYRGAGLVSFETTHRLYVPPLLLGDWSGFLSSMKGRFIGAWQVIADSGTYMNHFPLAVPFVGTAAVFGAYLIFGRSELRKMLLFAMVPVSLWFLGAAVMSRVFQVAYFTYFMPSFALILALALFELKTRSQQKRIVSPFLATLVWLILAINVVDAAWTNLRLHGYKQRYVSLFREMRMFFPHDRVVLGSTNYYQALFDRKKYYTWTFMQERCPDFGMTVRALDVDYVILDDILKNLSVSWCGQTYYDRQIVPFLQEQGALVRSFEVGYPNLNGSNNFLNEVYVFAVRKG